MKQFKEIREVSQAAQQQMDVYKFKKANIKQIQQYVDLANKTKGLVPINRVDPSIIANIKKNFPDLAKKLDDKIVNNIIITQYSTGPQRRAYINKNLSRK